MTALAFGVWLMSYWIFYFGLDQIQGGNDSFLSLGVPGRFSGAAMRDDGTVRGQPGKKNPGAGQGASKAGGGASKSGGSPAAPNPSSVGITQPGATFIVPGSAQ